MTEHQSSALLDLVAVMSRLRGPEGCPWDREQTHRSLSRYLLEETYELLDAIEVGESPTDMEEELGDLLLQIVFHAQIGAEGGEYDIESVARRITDKLRRRHPHVFGPDAAGDVPTGSPTSAADVERAWELIKADEKRRDSVLEGVPAHLPALQRAQQVLGRASGLDGHDVRHGVRRDFGMADVDPPVASARDLGERLLGLAAAAQAAGLDAEQSLRDAVRTVEHRVRAYEGARGRRQA